MYYIILWLLKRVTEHNLILATSSHFNELLNWKVIHLLGLIILLPLPSLTYLRISAFSSSPIFGCLTTRNTRTKGLILHETLNGYNLRVMPLTNKIDMFCDSYYFHSQEAFSYGAVFPVTEVVL